MSQITGIAEIVLAVHNMSESLKFYSDMLGLPTMSPVGPNVPIFLKVAETAGVPQMLVLVPLPQNTAAFTAPRTLHHLALEIAPEGFDAEQKRLESLGYKVRSGKHPVIPSRTMYINDPDGNEVELICTA